MRSASKYVGLLAFVTFLAFPIPLVPQSTAPQESTVLRSTTRFVQISVIVQDGKGQPVIGLKREDFRLYDEGKLQDIATFVSEAPPAEQKADSLPFNIFTNRFDRLGRAPSTATVILFDALNTQPQDQSSVRLQILGFLKELRPEDRVAIYALTTQLQILQDFTQDSSMLVNAVQRFLPKSTAALDASSVEQVDLVGMTGNPYWGDLQNAINRGNAVLSDRKTLNRVEMTTSALEAIGNHIASVSGRKNLIWVSGGFPFQLGLADLNSSEASSLGSLAPALPSAAQAQGPSAGSTAATRAAEEGGQFAPIQRESRTFQDEILRATKTLNRANVAVYPVDAKGVTVEGTTDVSTRETSTHAGSSEFFARRNNWDTLNETAERTGGIAFYGSNDVTSAMRKASDDGRYAYTLGFYPSHGKWDGKFRDVKVKVSVSGAKLRYRKGYFANSDTEQSAPEAKIEIQSAALSPLESTTLGLMVSAVPTEPAAARNITLQIGLDTLQLSLKEENAHHKGGIDLLFLQRDAGGKAVQEEQKRIGFDFTDEQYKALVKSGIILQRHVTADRSASEIRVLVHDAASGAIGTVTVPLGKLLAPAN
ncbi:MAG TPA: VWA domain-containing protein [Candidatus Dormibacteraeota bacterium]|jgi:VWFA-related protein|nr:VWA domain-containing protein [Candidatus Dormibacteraeota bacterium]